MKAADVRILPALNPNESCDDESFLLGETTISGLGEQTNIDHVTKAPRGGTEGFSKRAIAQSLPFTHRMALQWAVSFAALNEIPIVYERLQA